MLGSVIRRARATFGSAAALIASPDTIRGGPRLWHPLRALLLGLVLAGILGTALSSTSAARKYLPLSRLGVKASGATLSGRRLAVTIEAKRSVRLRLHVVQGRKVRASVRPQTVGKGTQTVVGRLDKTPGGIGLKLRVTATRGAKKGRRTIKLNVVPVVPPGPPRPAPPSPPSPPAAPGIPAAAPCGKAASPPARYDHVVWVVMENHSYSDVIGAASAPYVNQLASRCGSASKFFAESHPSLPNYIAMTSGSTQGISDDNQPSSHPLNVPSIFSQTSANWRALQESMPSNCLLTNSGLYAVKHNPAAYYTNIRTECGSLDVPLGLAPDVSARFTFVTPNLCNDTHDCSVQAGDSWLQGFLPKVFSSAEYQAGTTAVFLTWDEDDGSMSNQIPTLVIASSVAPGTTSTTTFNHYSMLRTTEELLGLDYLGNATEAASMRTAFGL